MRMNTDTKQCNVNAIFKLIQASLQEIYLPNFTILLDVIEYVIALEWKVIHFPHTQWGKKGQNKSDVYVMDLIMRFESEILARTQLIKK